MNWKIIFLLSLFGVVLGLGSLIGFGFFALFFWPVIIVSSVLVISSRVSGKYMLHGFVVAMMIQLWAGAMHAYYLFDSSRAGVVEVLPHGIHPQLMNLIETAAIGVTMGLIIGGMVSLAAKVPAKSATAIK